MWLAQTVCAISLLAVSSRASVIVVSSSGGGQFTNLQAAVNSAASGDTLLVKAGSYSSFTIDAKALSVVADTGATVTVNGSVIVQNLAANQNVVLAGFIVTGATTTSMSDTPGVALYATANSGALRVDACQLTGATGYGDHFGNGADCCYPSNHASGWIGARLAQNSGGIGFVGCTIRGGRAANAYFGCECGTGAPGGDGLSLDGTRVALYDCTIVGGRGGDGGGQAADGGAGCRAQSSSIACGLFASGTSFSGGNGGDGTDILYAVGGDGGSGLYADQPALAQLLDCTTQGGAGGISCGAPNGHPGQATSGTSQPFVFTGTRLAFDAPTPVRENTDTPVSFTGQPGEHVYLYMADATGFQALAHWMGVLVTNKSAPHQAVYAIDMGTIPQTGVLNTVLNFTDVASARTLYLQAFSIDAQGNKKLGSFATTVVLDSAY
jgi:hypothetical protein